MSFGNAVGQGFVNTIIETLTIANLGPGEGLWVYSTTTPMPNDLQMSFTGSAGTDSAGNVYFADFTVYGNAGGTYYAVNIADAAISFYSAPSEAGPWTLQGSVLVSTSAAETLLLEFANGVATNFGFTVDGGGDGTFQGNLSIYGTTLSIGNGTIADIELDPPMGVPADYPLSQITATPPTGAWYTNVDGVVNACVRMVSAMYNEMAGRGFFP
jgi:hypothetical protein